MKNLRFGIDFGSNYISICDDSTTKLHELTRIERKKENSVVSYYRYGNELEDCTKNYLSEIIKPIQSGIITDEEAMTELFFKLMDKVRPRGIFKKYEVLVSAECGLTAEEYNKIRELCYRAGADNVTFEPNYICAINGLNYENKQNKIFLLVDIGADKTTFYIGNNKDVLSGMSIKIGGNLMSHAVIRYIFKSKGIIVTNEELEKIKKDIFTLSHVTEGAKQYTLNGKISKTGELAKVKITYNEIEYIIKFYMDEIIKHLKVFISINNEYEHEIENSDIVLYGGVSKITGISEYFSTALNKRVICKNENLVILGLRNIIKNSY